MPKQSNRCEPKVAEAMNGTVAGARVLRAGGAEAVKGGIPGLATLLHPEMMAKGTYATIISAAM